MASIYSFLGLSDSEGSDDEGTARAQTSVKKQKRTDKREGKKSKGAKQQKESTPDIGVEHASPSPSLVSTKTPIISARKVALNASLEQLVPSRTVFVGNLSFDVGEAEVSGFFNDQVGGVSRVVLPRNNSGRPSGYAYVEFEAETRLSKALSLSGSTLRERPVTISRFRASRRAEMRTARLEKPKMMKKKRLEHRLKMKKLKEQSGDRQRRKDKRDEDDA